MIDNPRLNTTRARTGRRRCLDWRRVLRPADSLRPSCAMRAEQRQDSPHPAGPRLVRALGIAMQGAERFNEELGSPGLFLGILDPRQ